MKKLFLTLMVLVLTGASAFAATSNDKYVGMAEQWLSDLNMASADFRQIDYQGRELRGKFYINRPGRLRFEYEAPIEDHIIADGTFIYFHDGETGQANSAPIGATLADFILRSDVSMDGKMKVDSVRERDGLVQIAISQADQPGTGQLILNFTKDPFALNSWRIIDAQGLTTDIMLSNFAKVPYLDPRLFVYKPAQAQDRFNQ
jgi:outer membrane lipoprotein-sorting protein